MLIAIIVRLTTESHTQRKGDDKVIFISPVISVLVVVVLYLELDALLFQNNRPTNKRHTIALFSNKND